MLKQTESDLSLKVVIPLMVKVFRSQVNLLKRVVIICIAEPFVDIHRRIAPTI